MSRKSKKGAARTETKAARWTSGHTRAALGAILAWSLALGLAAVLQYRRSPYFNFPIVDEANFIAWADKIAAGDWLGSEAFYLDPLYPYTLALIFALCGKSLMLIRILQAGLGAASAGLAFLAARRLAGPRAGLAAALIIAAYHGLYFYELLLLKGVFVIFFSAAAIAAGARAADQPRSRSAWALTGLALGALTLLRGNFLALAPLALAFAATIEPGAEPGAEIKRRLVRVTLVLLGIAAVVMPVTIRNYAVSGELVVTTSQTGANFYIGNNELAQGYYTTLPFVRPDPEHERGDFQAEAERRAGRGLTSQEVSRFWFREGFKWIAAHPGAWVRLTLHKCHLLIHQVEVPDNYSFDLTRRHFVTALWAAPLGFGLMWGPAVFGMAVMLRRGRRAWWPLLFTLGYAASIIPFYIVDRYRLALVPGLAVFGGCFVAWLSERVLEKDFRSLALAGVWTAVSLAAGFWPIPEARATDPVCLYNLGNTYLALGKPGEALPWLERALAIVPGDRDAAAARAEALMLMNRGKIREIMRRADSPGATPAGLVELGKQLEQLGQTPPAAGLYERALAREPALLWPRGRLVILYRTDPLLLDPARAEAHLQSGLAYNPDNPELMKLILPPGAGG